MPDKASEPALGRSRPRGRSRRAGDAEALAAKLDITFHRPDLLRQALTHKSAEQELRVPSNERLEFLGDSVLDIVVAQYLYRGHPELAEGDLTKLKAVAVSEPALAAVAREIGLGRYLLLAKGEEQTGGRDRNSILADAMEALFAAVYLDRGLRITRDLILRLLGGQLEIIERREYEPDYKTSSRRISRRSTARPRPIGSFPRQGPTTIAPSSPKSASAGRCSAPVAERARSKPSRQQLARRLRRRIERARRGRWTSRGVCVPNRLCEQQEVAR